MKKALLNKTWIVVTALLLSLFLGFSAQSSVVPDIQQHQTDSYSFSMEKAEFDITLLPFSKAASFEHSRQIAQWYLIELNDQFTRMSVADDYLASEPILDAWYVIHNVSKYRLGGWKDASLIYKLINAYL